MTNMIRPTHAVQIPDGQTQGSPMNYGQSGYGQPSQQQYNGQSPVNILSQFLSTGSGGGMSGGGIDWSRYDNGVADDPALRELSIGNVEEDRYNLNNYLTRVIPHIGMLIESIAQRRGPMYDCFRESMDGFRMTSDHMATSQCRELFVQFLVKHPETHFAMGKNIGTYLTMLMVDKLKKNGGVNISAREILGMTELSCRNIFFFEMINWMSRTRDGRAASYYMDKDLEKRVASLDQIKEVASKAWLDLGMPFPYSDTEFRREAPSQSYIPVSTDPLPGFYDFNDPNPQGQTRDPHARSEWMQWIHERNVRFDKEQRYGAGIQSTHYDPPNPLKDTPAFNTVRYDLENLTKENRNEYDLTYWFHPIPGYTNRYLIGDPYWKKIQKVLPKSDLQGPEETCLDFYWHRIVTIDLQGDQTWTSETLRSKTVLSKEAIINPSRLLPELQAMDNGEVVVSPTMVTRKASELITSEAPQVPRTVIAEMNQEFTVVTYDEKPLIGKDSTELEISAVNINKHLTQNVQNMSVVSMEIIPEEIVSCENEKIKDAIKENLAFMFEGSDELNGLSFYTAVKELRYVLSNGDYGRTLPITINERLTKFFNEYLVNEAGYDPRPEANNHLSVTSILDDLDEVMEILQEEEPLIHDILSIAHRDCSLKWKLQMFRAEDDLDEDAPQTIADIAQRSVQLTIYRPITNVMVNKDPGFLHTANETVLLRRSKTPIYFELMERGFEALHGDLLDYNNHDKVIQFSHDNSRWLFSSSVFDPNIVVARHITRRGKMTTMIFD